MNLEQAWSRLAGTQGTLFNRWTESQAGRVRFRLRQVEGDGSTSYRVETETGRQPRGFDFAKFTDFWQLWSAGKRRPDEYRNAARDQSMFKLAYYLLPILKHIDAQANLSGGDQNVGYLMRALSRHHVLSAIARSNAGDGAQFSDSTKYDLAHKGQLYPPKRVMGLALEELTGRQFSPTDFKGGQVSMCFRVLHALAFEIRDKSGTPVLPFNRAPDSFVASASEEVQCAVSPLKLPKKGQGRGLTAQERRAVEVAAMEVAKTELIRCGFTRIQDVSSTHSCDYLAWFNSSEWIIEVKGTTGAHDDDILLTANEVDLHRERPDCSGLIVVSNIELNRQTGSASGGRPKFYRPWQLEEWLLEPTAFRATLITGE